MPGQLTMATVERRTKVYDEGRKGPELRAALDTGRRRTLGLYVNGAGVDAEQAKVLFDGETEPRWVDVSRIRPASLRAREEWEAWWAAFLATGRPRASGAAKRPTTISPAEHQAAIEEKRARRSRC